MKSSVFHSLYFQESQNYLFMILHNSPTWAVEFQSDTQLGKLVKGRIQKTKKNSEMHVLQNFVFRCLESHDSCSHSRQGLAIYCQAWS